MKSTNSYNSFINTPFSDLFRPAIEYVDSSKTGKYRPDKDIAEKTGCNSLAEALEKKFGNKDYNTYKGRITDHFSIKRRVEDIYYLCQENGNENATLILTSYTMVKSAFSDIFEDLTELSTVALRTTPDEVPFLHTKVDDLDEKDIASAFVIMENRFDLDKEEILKEFPELTIGDVLSASYDTFREYRTTDDEKEIFFWGNVVGEAEKLMTNIFFMPWIKENTNLL